jgi:F0F1-type ATP synthase membrane subunit b/b'
MDRQRELWGRRFRIVKNGLDETDVVSYVDGLRYSTTEIERKLERIDSIITHLAEQYQELAGRADFSPTLTHLTESPDHGSVHGRVAHVESLKRLAEKTVMEADRQAELILSEVQERAQVDADRILVEARQRAQDITLEARQQAENEVLSIRREVEQLLDRSRTLLEGEIRGMFDQASRQLLDEMPDTSAGSSDPQSGDQAPDEASTPDQPEDGRQPGDDPYQGTLELAIAPMTLYSH